MAIPRELAFAVGEYQQRVESVQRRIGDAGLDGLVLFGPHNICYLAGMDSENLFDFQALVLPRQGEPVLVILDFELARYENSSWVEKTVVYGAFDDPVAVTANLVRSLCGAVATIGVEQPTIGLTADRFQRFVESLPGATVRNPLGVVESVRLVKSAAEIEYMRRAAALTDAGVEAGFATAAPGVPDFRVAAAVVDTMYRSGSDTVCWGPVVAGGYRAGSAHSTFNGYILKPGDTLFLELTGEVRRYVAPLMRTAVLGRPTPEIGRIAAAGEAAVETILREARHGVPASAVARAAQKVLEPVLPDVVFHSYFGYSVGLGYPPTWIERLDYFIRVDNDRPLERGMVFHLPISLRKYGEFGVNLSHTILIGDDGAEPLTRTPARLRVLESGV